MKLYCHPISVNCRKVLITAALMNVDLDLAILNIEAGEHRGAAYLAVNPNGMIPALDDEGFVLWESNAITQYIASTRGPTDLFPADARRRADVTRWQLWDVAHWARAVQTLAFERMYKKLAGLGPPDAARVDDALREFRRATSTLDAHLRGRDVLVGDALTLADISIACGLTFARAADMPVGENPNVQRWLASVERLDVWNETLPKLGASR